MLGASCLSNPTEWEIIPEGGSQKKDAGGDTHRTKCHQMRDGEIKCSARAEARMKKGGGTGRQSGTSPALLPRRRFAQDLMPTPCVMRRGGRRFVSGNVPGGIKGRDEVKRGVYLRYLETRDERTPATRRYRITWMSNREKQQRERYGLFSERGPAG